MLIVLLVNSFDPFMQREKKWIEPLHIKFKRALKIIGFLGQLKSNYFICQWKKYLLILSQPVLSVHSVVSDWQTHSNWLFWLEIEGWVHTANPTCFETWWGWVAARKFASSISKEDVNALSRGRDLFIINIWEYIKIVDDVEVDFVATIKCKNTTSSNHAADTNSSWRELGFTQSQMWIDISLSIEDQTPKYEGRTNQIWNISCYISATFLNEVRLCT